MFRSIGRWLAYPVIAVVVVLVIAGVVSALDNEPAVPADRSMKGVGFDARYELEPSSEGGLDVLVTETITVNMLTAGSRGIIRAIPLKYQGHYNTISYIEVEGRLTLSRGGDDPSWERVAFERTTSTKEVVELKIGSGAYLARGQQQYRITYMLHDVAMNTPDGAAQELYLDVNGTAWGTSFESVSARVEVPAELAPELNGNTACYEGAAGSTTRCGITRSGTDPLTLTSSVGDVAAGETLTFAIGFQPGTFGQAYTPTRGEGAPWLFVMPALALVVLGLITIPPFVRRRRLDRQVLVTRFDPPEGIEPVVAADVWGAPERGIAAQLTKAVVQGQLHLISDEPSSSEKSPTGARPSARDIDRVRRAVRITGLDNLDDRGAGSLLRGYFPSSRLGSGRYNQTLADRRSSLVSEAGQRASISNPGGWFMPAYVFGVVGIGLVSLVALRSSGGLLVPALVSAVVTVLILVQALYRTDTSGRLTVRGEATYQHLRGLNNFMRLSEADRIAWLQSTETAPRVADGSQTRIKLYEPLLPYAVIFGLEGSWAALLGDASDGLPAPSWMPTLSGIDLTDVLRSVPTTHYHDYGGTRTMGLVNQRVSNGFNAAGSAFADMFKGGNDGSGGGSSWSGSGGGWSSGGSGGGGSAGGGMGGGGGRSW